MGLIYAQCVLGYFQMAAITTHENVERSHILFDFYLLLLNIHWYKLQKRSKTKILFSSKPKH